MCGRYVTGSDELTWREWVEILRPTIPLPVEAPAERFVGPGTQVPTLAVPADDSGAGLSMAAWGFRFKNDKRLYFNLRAETLGKRFPDSASDRRCLFPARSFEIAEGESGKNRVRHRAKSHRSLFLAGVWTASEEPPGRRAAIATRPSWGPLASLHPRMPLIVPPALAIRWLVPGDPTSMLQSLLDADGPELLLGDETSALTWPPVDLSPQAPSRGLGPR